MSKLKSKIVWMLGLSIAKLKNFPVLTKMSRYLRLRYPRIWSAIIKKIKPFYWTYQVSALNDHEDTSFKEISAFNEQQWQKKLLRKRTYNTNLIKNGVMNNRPVVEAVVILERINRAATLHKN